MSKNERIALYVAVAVIALYFFQSWMTTQQAQQAAINQQAQQAAQGTGVSGILDDLSEFGF